METITFEVLEYFVFKSTLLIIFVVGAVKMCVDHVRPFLEELRKEKSGKGQP